MNTRGKLAAWLYKYFGTEDYDTNITIEEFLEDLFKEYDVSIKPRENEDERNKKSKA